MFITIDTYIKKQERSQIENLILYLKKLEEKQMTPRISRRNEIRKSRNKWLETKRGIENINETKSCFFSQKINKTTNPLAKLTKKKKEDSNK